MVILKGAYNLTLFVAVWQPKFYLLWHPLTVTLCQLRRSDRTKPEHNKKKSTAAKKKKLENGWKKSVRPAFGCTQHLKAGQNAQQLREQTIYATILYVVIHSTFHVIFSMVIKTVRSMTKRKRGYLFYYYSEVFQLSWKMCSFPKQR